MKAFGLAFTLWGGTILFFFGFMFFAGVFFLSFWAIVIAIATFFGALILGCPLLLPTTLLIELARKIPYSVTVRLYWLGFTLLLQNYLYLELLMFVDAFEFGMGVFRSVFAISVPCLVIMLFFKRNALKNFFLQTTNKTS